MNIKRNLSILLALSVLLNSCLFSNHKKKPRELLGYDFELFDHTPVKELMAAVKDQDVKKIEELIRVRKVPVDFQEKKFGHTVLMLANMYKFNKSIRVLLDCKADPNLKGRDGESSFHIACSTNTYECNTTAVKMMIDYGANVNDLKIDTFNTGMHKTTPLIIASRAGCLETVKLLVKNGAKIDFYLDEDNYGAISEALIQDNLDIAKYLIIDCKAPIPEYCTRVRRNEKWVQFSITDVLNEDTFEKGTDNYRYKKEILAYLEQRGLR